MDKLAEETTLKEKMLKVIFDELEEKSYDIDFHGYHYKEANQIIRHYFEILIKSYHEAKLKEELIKFKYWFNTKYPAPTDIIEKKDVNDYLKTEKRGTNEICQ